MLRKRPVAWGVLASLALHGVWIGTLDPESSAKAAGLAAYEVPLEIGPQVGSSTATEWLAATTPILPGGPRSESALDLTAHDGRGGDATSADRPALLFSFVSPLTLQDTELNNLKRSQTQRIETARTRATQEERRATPNPADEVFLASGSVGHRERRKPAPRDALAGAPTYQQRENTPDAARLRADRGGPSAAPSVHAESGPVTSSSAARAQAAKGILRGEGVRPSRAARVAHARPNLDRGPAATPAEQLDPRVRDDVDAELLAASLQRSIVDSSTQRAALAADGQGGVAAPSQLGLSARGDARGSRALPYLPGAGAGSALDTSDARYLRWFTEQRARVQNELVFPKPRALAMDQGVSVYRVVVSRDGKLSGSPHLVRSSGYADFDEAAVVAIRRAVPFSPLPDRLVPESADVTVVIPVAFSNPMIQ